MSWPHWIEDLKERYLADEGNAFLLHGDGLSLGWTVEGEATDTVGVLVRFLRRTRPVVGVLRPAPPPSRLEFADLGDRQRFENLVRAQEVVEGLLEPLSEAVPEQALGRIWRALGTRGTDQAWIVLDAARLLPAHRKRVEPIPGAPPLADWSASARLRGSNHLLILLAPSIEAIDPAVARALVPVRVGAAPDEPHEVAVALAHLEHDVPAPPPAPAGRTPPPDDLGPALQRALVHALVVHPEEHRPAKLPVMQAVAEVVAARRPDRWGALGFALAEDGEVVVDGPGAADFLAAWRGDIALDAAAGMILKALPSGFSEQAPPPLDPTGLAALTRRVGRLL